MVHKALNLLESRLPPLLVRRLVGLPFWLYSLSLKASFIMAQDTVDLGRLQRLAGKTTLFSRLYFTPRPRHLAISLSSP